MDTLSKLGVEAVITTSIGLPSCGES